MKLILPYPPSANNYWRRAGYIIHPTAEAKRFKKNVAEICLVSGIKSPQAGPIGVVMQFYRPRKVGDLDNYIKVLFDSLNGIVWVDDSQIITLSANRHDDKTNPRVEIEIRALGGKK